MEEVDVTEERVREQDRRVMKEETRRAMSTLCKISRENGVLLCLGLLSSSLMGAFFTIIAVTFADAIRSINDLAVYTGIGNQSEADRAEDEVNSNGLYILLVVIGLLIFQFFITLAFGWISEHVTFSVRKMAFHSLLKKSIKWYEDPHHTPPAVVASLSTDAALLNSVTSTAIGALI